MAEWKIASDNDTGPNDDYFVEWWDVSNGERSFRCNSEEDAKWLYVALSNLAFDPAKDELK